MPSNTHIKSDGKRDGETKTYRVFVTDTFNDNQISATQTWLEGLVKDKTKMRVVEVFPWEKAGGWDEDEFNKWSNDGKYNSDVFNNMKVDGWSLVLLDSAGYEEVSKKTGWVRAIKEPLRQEIMGPVPGAESNRIEDLEPRKFSWGDWEAQEGDATILSQISCYKPCDHIESENDYVYEKRAGEGVLVYLVEYGVQVDVKWDKDKNIKYFPDIDSNEIVQTEPFTKTGKDPRLDQGTKNKGHTTRVASQIVGKYGAAKKVTLVPVQVVEKDNDQEEPLRGFREALKHYIEKQKTSPNIKAVFVMAMGWSAAAQEPQLTRETAEQDEDGKSWMKLLKSVWNAGIPVVLASGNDGSVRKDIDMIPQVLEKGDDFPIINVGAAEYWGKAWSSTQGQGTGENSQLTIYAVGVDVLVQNNVNGVHGPTEGTSFAAPAVAGVIALHSVYEPWDKGMKKEARVKAIRNFIRSPESSWTVLENQPLDVNMIWNGADEDAYKQVGLLANTQSTATTGSSQQPTATAAPQPQSDGKSLIIGLEQIGSPRCTSICPPLANAGCSTTCDAQHDYENRLFFYSLNNHVEEVVSLCTS
ncbi:subtilisin-like protein [Lophiostoma macrostomum CBS 122681]|uniref:Subtilisin-like protein n=1 Tax=Lophiostoma macrostomum CBS 122681 TaxID=1314788 RepID=A0A6A6TTX8_9PLEO|nr:subtilisin-like protein [Lophiostoma macrostomum CBS 122681]